MKETFGSKVKEKSDERISIVIILRGTEGEPKSRLAPSRARVTERETVGDEK